MDITNILNGKGPSSRSEEQRRQRHMAQVTSDTPESLKDITAYPSPAEPSPTVNRLSDAPDKPPHNGTHQRQQTAGAVCQKFDWRDHNAALEPSIKDGVRTFSCNTCGKGFARRSDLARHERIHSGDRPHVCPEPGCGKPFIQRSALTVHMRVHSGEKPHMCERCAKPFSDSSSLARHRRTHSGKRPYKCPFADCQKTFTRRTTLTRHQSHHTGTVEEAAVATARILASRGPSRRRAGSDGSVYSDTPSQLSPSINTPSASEREFSLSPSTDLPSMPSLNRPTSNLSFHSTDSFPPHMRNGIQQPSPRSSPSASSSSLPTSNFHRSSLTSHPLPVLEPPAYHETRSASGSPHFSGAAGGWQSHIHHSMPSHTAGDLPIIYPVPHHLPFYHSNGNLPRPQRTEPERYGLKPRLSMIHSGYTCQGSIS
ncbi:MAG: hypothetical protein Q9163_006444 [Psora crenata]